jgi:hypothetical protein
MFRRLLTKPLNVFSVTLAKLLHNRQNNTFPAEIRIEPLSQALLASWLLAFPAVLRYNGPQTERLGLDFGGNVVTFRQNFTGCPPPPLPTQ